MSNHVIHVTIHGNNGIHVVIHVTQVQWSPNVSFKGILDKMVGGWVGWVKKCFQGLRQTALLSAKGKKRLIQVEKR
jgi:hypothetical protein